MTTLRANNRRIMHHHEEEANRPAMNQLGLWLFFASGDVPLCRSRRRHFHISGLDQPGTSLTSCWAWASRRSSCPAASWRISPRRPSRGATAPPARCTCWGRWRPGTCLRDRRSYRVVAGGVQGVRTVRHGLLLDDGPARRTRDQRRGRVTRLLPGAATSPRALRTAPSGHHTGTCRRRLGLLLPGALPGELRERPADARATGIAGSAGRRIRLIHG